MLDSVRWLLITQETADFLLSLSSRTLYRVYLALLAEKSIDERPVLNQLTAVSEILRRRGFWEGEHTR
jgi:hypothetical protein